MTIYVDLLFIVNLMMNTLILAGAVILAREKVHRFRLLTAAALGALYSVLMFFPEAKFMFWMGMRLATGAVMVWVGIPTGSLYRYFRALMYFYVCMLAMGGGMYAFYTLTGAGAEMVYSNGIYYVDLPLWLLLVLSFSFYGLVRLAAGVHHHRRPVEGLVEIEVCCQGKYRSVTAFLDTGNSLIDPLTLTPVVVVEAGALRGVVPEEICRAAERKNVEQLETLRSRFAEVKCRLVPWRSVGGESRLMLAVRPDWIRLAPTGKPYENVLLGLCGDPLSPDGSYRALLHNDISL